MTPQVVFEIMIIFGQNLQKKARVCLASSSSIMDHNAHLTQNMAIEEVFRHQMGGAGLDDDVGILKKCSFIWT